MRIALVTHAVVLNDGQGRVNYEIARHALNAGYAVTLIASRVAPELLAHPLARWVRIGPSRLPSALLRYQHFALGAALWLARHRGEFDIVHLNGFICWTRADLNTVHFVHSAWLRCGHYPFRFYRGLRETYQLIYTQLNARLERWALRRARIAVAVSRKVAEEIASIVPADRIQVIHNGIDAREFAPGPAERARFGLPAALSTGSPPPFIALFAGDLRVPRKNLDTVLRALSHAPAQIHLAVAGEARGSAYPALARALGIAARVHFIGFVSEMPALMRSVDAFVFPSRYEPFGLALLEALACGLPVITALTAGCTEVIDPGSGIVLNDPNDASALAAALTSLATDRARAREMGQAARQQALTLSWHAMAERYLALYQSLAPHAILKDSSPQDKKKTLRQKAGSPAGI